MTSNRAGRGNNAASCTAKLAKMRFARVPGHKHTGAKQYSQQHSAASRASSKVTRKSIKCASESVGLNDSRRGPSTQVELSFSARNLANRDFISKSDPQCIVYRSSAVKNGRLKELARTETIKDQLNPDWTRRVRIDYYFEFKQLLVFKIYDIDIPDGPLNDQDFLGSAQCDLADIVAAPNRYLTLKLGGNSFVRGDLIVHAQELDHGQRETLCFDANVNGLRRRSIFSNPNVYLEFYRFLEDGSRHLAYRTPVSDNTTSPSWVNQEISLRYLCNCNKDLKFLIECYDNFYNGHSPRFIGSAITTINSILGSLSSQLTLTKRNRRRASVGDKSEKIVGTVTLEAPHLRLDHTFLDYVAGGLQLEFAVCVDFTASNGQPHSMQSLHYIGSSTPNQYETAIRAVLEICQHYNHRKVFDATGFGAKIPPRYEDITNRRRQCDGVDGVLRVYKSAIHAIELYGPTYFGPSIAEFVHKTRQMSEDGSQYQILLILTDGAIKDMNRTKDLIIRASELPISIIIIGLGNDSFDKMDKLDSDNNLLEHNGRQAKRDIVQFVPFRDFVPANGQFASEAEYQETMRLLAKEVLAEVPEQVTSYMRSKNLKPQTSNSFTRVESTAPVMHVMGLMPGSSEAALGLGNKFGGGPDDIGGLMLHLKKTSAESDDYANKNLSDASSNVTIAVNPPPNSNTLFVSNSLPYSSAANTLNRLSYSQKSARASSTSPQHIPTHVPQRRATFHAYNADQFRIDRLQAPRRSKQVLRRPSADLSGQRRQLPMAPIRESSNNHKNLSLF